MRDFVVDNGRIVGRERYDFLEELSYAILLLPIVIIVSLLLYKGTMTFDDIVEFLANQNQLHLFGFACLLVLLFFRLAFYRGSLIVFDKGRNELSSSYEFRFGLRWNETWRLDEIGSVEAVPVVAGARSPSRVIVRFKRGKYLKLGDTTDPARALATVQRLRTHLGI